MSTKVGNILTFGAGIAGLTLAHCLQHRGFTPTIVAKGPTPHGKAVPPTLPIAGPFTVTEALFSKGSTCGVSSLNTIVCVVNSDGGIFAELLSRLQSRKEQFGR